MKKPVIVAPGGSYEKAIIAAKYGAEEVYIGVPFTSLRMRQNKVRDFDELKKTIKAIHEYGSKALLTMNIFPRNTDIKIFESVVEKISDTNPDAIIFSDPGTFNVLRKYFPNVPLHLSTQTSTLNYESIKFRRDLGVKRIVLARELHMDEIKEIRKQVPDIELEVFVHGAMCMSYSGRCLLGDYMSGRQANKGECNHACRFKYKVWLEEERRPGKFFQLVENEEATHILSSKDLCTIDRLEELLPYVDALKIEGRSKSEFYVGAVVKAYKEARDAILSGREVDLELKDLVNKIPHRKYWDGFLFNSLKDFPETEEGVEMSDDKGVMSDDKMGISDDMGAMADDKMGISDDMGAMADDKMGISDDKGVMSDDKMGISDDKGVMSDDKMGIPDDMGAMADDRGRGKYLNREYDELTFDIIGIAMDVHNQLGPGLLEKVYSKGLVSELKKRGYDVQKEKRVEYKINDDVVGTGYIDLIVNSVVALELKSTKVTKGDYYKQLRSYMKNNENIKVGFIFNFYNKKLDFKRLDTGHQKLSEIDSNYQTSITYTTGGPEFCRNYFGMFKENFIEKNGKKYYEFNPKEVLERGMKLNYLSADKIGQLEIIDLLKEGGQELDRATCNTPKVFILTDKDVSGWEILYE